MTPRERPSPKLPRVKTYSAASGWVYQYQFHDRHRESRGSEGDGYHFTAWLERTSPFDIEVLVPDAAIAQWERDGGRELSLPERYALAKMALFDALDQAETPAAIPKPVRLEAEGVAAIARALDL